MKEIRNIAAGVFSLMALIAFVIVFGSLAWNAATGGGVPAIDQGVAALGVVVAGLVSNIIATWFGVKVGATNKLGAFGWRIPGRPEVQTGVALAYLAAYLVISMAALYGWMAHPTSTPELLRTQIAVALGLSGAVGVALMKD